jgi:[protein-PII] uridylyltransferase
LTSWKARVLDELFVSAESRLSSGAVDIVDAKETVCAAVLQQVESTEESARVERFLRMMPERYLLANEPRHILSHARFVISAGRAPAKVEAVSVELPYAQFAFLADDRPGLLAKIAGSIAVNHVEVVVAQVYSFVDDEGRPRALDLFWVYAGERVRTGKTFSSRFERDLLQQLDAGTSTQLVLERLPAQGGRWGSRVTPAVDNNISIDNRGATHATILEVITRDRPGLLFELANTIQELGLVITLAKINTEGHLVADVFYVTEQNGDKVIEPLRLEALKVRILRAIGSN